MDTRVLEVISSQINEQVTLVKDHLGTGQPKDYAEYRELCGKLQGLLVSQRIVKDLERNLEQADD